MGELRQFFEQGSEDLRRTAGERAVLRRRADNTVHAVTVAATSGEVTLEVPTATGAVLTCGREVLVSRAEYAPRPMLGDTVTLEGRVYEIRSVSGWHHDPDWHLNLVLKK